jgi:hypothetical protein
MFDTDDLALWYALNRLVTNYWADVDDEGGSHAHEFYTPKALYSVGNNRFVKIALLGPLCRRAIRFCSLRKWPCSTRWPRADLSTLAIRKFA